MDWTPLTKLGKRQLATAQFDELAPYNDTPTPQELQRLYQQLLNQNAVYRNVGPNDLTAFPDRNAIHPDEIMRAILGLYPRWEDL